MMVQGKAEALWKAGDVADFLGIHKDSVYRLVREGRLPAVRVGKLMRFRPEDIRAIKDAGLPAEGAA